jgi:magnesium transporter
MVMDLEGRLAARILESQPEEAARALERLPAARVAGFLETPPPRAVARVLAPMHADAAAAVLAGLPAERAARILEELSVDAGALRLRHLDAAVRDAILEALPARRSRALGSVLRYPEHSAGALMDPDVLALPADLSVGEALERVRVAARNARYNLYVVDRNDRLVGVVNLRELLLASADDTLGAIMRGRVHRIAARADRRSILAHPGWRDVHALPVVDERGAYLGAIRYRTLRRLEAELRGAPPDAGATARALGDLFRTGASAMLEAVASSSGSEPDAQKAGR